MDVAKKDYFLSQTPRENSVHSVRVKRRLGSPQHKIVYKINAKSADAMVVSCAISFPSRHIFVVLYHFFALITRSAVSVQLSH